jgi:ATP-dependent protease ClpP protease subunit
MIRLDGMVGEAFTAADVADALALAGGEDVAVTLNSAGGYATEGAAIHAELTAYRGRVAMRVTGIAASAASLIAMAGDEIVMAAGAVLMIHDPALWIGSGRGTADDHRRDADTLDTLSEAYAAIYAARSGNSLAAVREWMRSETWLTGPEAVALGFADRAETSEDETTMAAAVVAGMARVQAARAQAAMTPQNTGA